MNEKNHLTTGDVAKILDVHFTTVFRWVKTGVAPFPFIVLPGGNHRIPVKEFNEWYARSLRESLEKKPTANLMGE